MMKKKKIVDLGKEAELSMELTPVSLSYAHLSNRTRRSSSFRTNIWLTDVTPLKKTSKTLAKSEANLKGPTLL